MGINLSLSWDNGLKLAFTKYAATCIFWCFWEHVKKQYGLTFVK